MHYKRFTPYFFSIITAINAVSLNIGTCATTVKIVMRPLHPYCSSASSKIPKYHGKCPIICVRQINSASLASFSLDRHRLLLV
jgi:hypothetical protein